MNKLNLYKDLTDDEKKKIKEKQNVDTFNKLFYVSILFGLIGIIYFITDMATGYYEKDFGHLDFAAVILLLVSSISVLTISRLFKAKIINNIQSIAAVYFLAINSVMLLFLSADLNTSKPDFLICFFNFVLINFVINYNVILSVITEAMVFIASIAIIIAFTPAEARLINVEQSAIILLGTIAAQHYLRTIVTKSFIKELNIEQISKEFELSSTVDFLTKLSNRKGLDMFINNEIENAVEEGVNISATMIDIDDFKSYNDHYSHMTGDQCLKRIGADLNKLCVDKFHAFRYGGEEFLVIGLNVNADELHSINNQILTSVQNLGIDRSKVRSVENYITVSIGSSIATLANIEDLKDLLSLADSRLYTSKRNGKNRITEN